VTCSCCWSAFRYEPDAIFKGSPEPNTACERYRKAEGKNNNALFLAASLIAAVRLNRKEIKLSPVVQSKIADSVRLAEMIQRHLERNQAQHVQKITIFSVSFDVPTASFGLPKFGAEPQRTYAFCAHHAPFPRFALRGRLASLPPQGQR